MLPRVLLGATRVLQSRHTVLLCSQILTQYACECVCKCVSSGNAVGGRDFACNTVMGLGQMSASSDAFAQRQTVQSMVCSSLLHISQALHSLELLAAIYFLVMCVQQYLISESVCKVCQSFLFKVSNHMPSTH